MTWFVASLVDYDTHQVTDLVEGSVTALCGYEFHPLTRLRGAPLDPLQVCRICAQAQPTDTRG